MSLEHRRRLVELRQRLLEHRLLLLRRQRIEDADLKLQRLEPDDLLARTLRAAEHVLLDASLAPESRAGVSPGRAT